MTISGPMQADSEAILATEKTEARRRGWSVQRPGEKDKIQGRRRAPLDSVTTRRQ